MAEPPGRALPYLVIAVIVAFVLLAIALIVAVIGAGG
jgi:hypothetical protein